jgi:Antitoxin to bacterial toxin RNase LS or RnlA
MHSTEFDISNFKLISFENNQILAIGLDYGYPSIARIEQALMEKEFSGTLYIDALLSNGVAFNRFMTGNVVNGVLDRKSLKVCNPSIVTQCLKSEAQKFFKANPQYVESNSILMDDQKADLLK